jgi:hypothetical protein
MKYPAGNHGAFRESLRRVYFEKEGLEVGDRWRLETMTRIRALGILKKRPDFWLGLEQMVWRLTPVTCALLFICMLIYLGSDSFHDYEVLSVFTTGTEEVSLSEILGFGA